MAPMSKKARTELHRKHSARDGIADTRIAAESSKITSFPPLKIIPKADLPHLALPPTGESGQNYVEGWEEMRQATFKKVDGRSAKQLKEWIDAVASVKFSIEELSMELRPSAIPHIIAKGGISGKPRPYADAYFTSKWPYAVANEERHRIIERAAKFLDDNRYHLTDPEILFFIYAVNRATKIGEANRKNPANNHLATNFKEDGCFLRVVLMVIIYGPTRLRNAQQKKPSGFRLLVSQYYPGWNYLEDWFPPTIAKACPWSIFGWDGERPSRKIEEVTGYVDTPGWTFNNVDNDEGDASGSTEGSGDDDDDDDDDDDNGGSSLSSKAKGKRPAKAIKGGRASGKRTKTSVRFPSPTNTATEDDSTAIDTASATAIEAFAASAEADDLYEEYDFFPFPGGPPAPRVPRTHQTSKAPGSVSAYKTTRTSHASTPAAVAGPSTLAAAPTVDQTAQATVMQLVADQAETIRVLQRQVERDADVIVNQLSTIKELNEEIERQSRQRLANSNSRWIMELRGRYLAGADME
ncbi:hypothetical protein HJFPF1_11325 [Paramyrothecium foliicola]|nr:hypothetical protein HJFPF1_11325 [Paramyrothecium foliicola]